MRRATGVLTFAEHSKHSPKFLIMKPRAKASRQVQSEINEILCRHWDPLDLSDALPKDEYQGYVGAVYRALVNGEGVFRIVRLLAELESKIGCQSPIARKREAARRLCALNVVLEDRTKPK